MIKQLIVVKARGSRCRIYCLERSVGGFIQVLPTMDGFVGKNGVSFQKKEGDGKTPAGLYKIGHAFGMGKGLRTGLPYRQIRYGSRWCSNPQSKNYNTYTEKAWETNCEDLWKYKREYRYGAVIEYNMGKDTIKGRGSAIFLHCKLSPTAGCVAAKKDCIKRILAWLNIKKNPHILIKNQ